MTERGQAPFVHVALIARVGADVGGALAALAAAGVTAPSVERDDGTGLASARNRALAACGAEVLALVEDDVRVAPTWRHALEAAWREERVGCVGGPLRAAFPGGRPAWLSDPLLTAFALQDREGPTYHAGNVSFRAAALRGVGGFWPARGHADGRDWFSDEHHAQRELAAAGWTAAWAPAAAADRVVPVGLKPRDVVRRRARYGARDTLIGARRPPTAAARTALLSAAGTTLALARPAAASAELTPAGRAGGRFVDATVVERAARTAENLGALAAPLLAHGDLQPALRATPFRHTLPPPAPGPLRRARAALRPARRETATTILLYHRIATPEHDPLGLAIAPDHFAAHLEVLGDRVIALDEAAAGRPGVALTFDDGYHDNLTVAAPLLRAAAVPATLFVTTGVVAAQKAFWWDALDRAVRAAPADAGPLTLPGFAWPARTTQERRVAFVHLHRRLQGRPPEEQDAALGRLAAWAGIDLAPPPADRPLTPEELTALATTFTLGAHTRTHRSLGQATPAEQRAELARSGDDLAAWTGRAPAAVSYPYGVPGVDVTRTTLALASELGYALGVVNAPGSVRPGTDGLALPRRVPPNAGAETFAAWLRAAHTVPA